MPKRSNIKFNDAVSAGVAYCQVSKVDKINENDDEYIEIVVCENGTKLRTWISRKTAVLFSNKLKREISKIN